MPYLLLLLEGAYEIKCFYGFGWRNNKNSELWGQASVGKRKLIRNVNNIASYAVPYDSTNLQGGRLSSTSIVKKICFVSKEIKGNAC